MLWNNILWTSYRALFNPLSKKKKIWKGFPTIGVWLVWKSGNTETTEGKLTIPVFQKPRKSGRNCSGQRRPELHCSIKVDICCHCKAWWWQYHTAEMLFFSRSRTDLEQSLKFPFENNHPKYTVRAKRELF